MKNMYSALALTLFLSACGKESSNDSPKTTVDEVIIQDDQLQNKENLSKESPFITKLGDNGIELDYDSDTWKMLELKESGLIIEAKTLANSNHEVTYQAALDYCLNLDLAGFTDWRLPSQLELSSIFSVSIFSDKERAYFPFYYQAPKRFDSSTVYYYFSASESKSKTGFASVQKVVHFRGEWRTDITHLSKPDSSAHRTTCVRGIEATEIPFQAVTSGTPSLEFIESPFLQKVGENGVELKANATPWDMVEVVDLGLYIENKTLPNKNLTYKYNDAKQYCDELDLNGVNNWRLATVNELKSIFTLIENSNAEQQYFPYLDIGKNTWSSTSAMQIGIIVEGVETTQEFFYSVSNNLSERLTNPLAFQHSLCISDK
jgi:hypothetical protein